jgi:putative hydrolase of the HAD superfamily
MKKKSLVLDAMGVVFVKEDETRIGGNVDELLIPFLRRRYDYLDVAKLKGLYYDQVSLGRISSKEFFRLLGLPDVAFVYLDECLKIDSDFLAVGRDLCEKYVLVMFSNDVSEWSLYLRRKFKLDTFFSKYIISGDVGLRKPNPRIYQVLLEQLEVSAKECVFVDNSLKNLEPASKLGMTTVYFKRSEFNYQYKPDFVLKDFFELKRLL